MKGLYEANVRKALDAMDLVLFAYKPPDDARNWKPADFLVWIGRGVYHPASHWLEVKTARRQAVDAFPTAELRPAQRLGIQEAKRLGIPYSLVIWWPRHRYWTISDAVRLDLEQTSLDRTELMSRYGVSAKGPGELASVLRLWLLGDAR